MFAARRLIKANIERVNARDLALAFTQPDACSVLRASCFVFVSCVRAKRVKILILMLRKILSDKFLPAVADVLRRRSEFDPKVSMLMWHAPFWRSAKVSDIVKTPLSLQ